MRPYPIMMRLAGRSAVVVGGGSVGRRKAEGLLAAGAEVTVVDPAPGDGWPEGVRCVAEPYRREHLAGAAVVIACTDDEPANARVAADARAGGTPVNVSDDPDKCDFTLPAIHLAGGVLVTVATTAGSSAVSAMVRDLIAEALPADIPEFADAVAVLRAGVKASVADPKLRRRALMAISSRDGLATFRRNGVRGLREILDAHGIQQ